LDGVDPSQVRWFNHFMSLAGGYETAAYGVTIPTFPDKVDLSTFWRDAVPNAALLGLLNGRFVVAEFPISAPDLILRTRAGSSYVYENQRWLPRAFVTARAARVASWQEAQARLAAGFDPAQGALVEVGPPLDGPAGWQPVSIRHMSPNRIVVEVTSSRPVLLVLSEVWYPGWRVTVDGVRQPYYRVNGIVRGTYLEPGAHIVTWHYRPASLLFGGLVTVSTLMGLIVGKIIWYTRHV
jgi:hypothetical protein